MAYYSDSDHYHSQYQPHYQFQYQPQYQFQHQPLYQFQHQPHHYHYAPLDTQTTYCYNSYDYDVSNAYYGDHSQILHYHPVAYSVAPGYGEPKRVHWADGGGVNINMDLVVDDDDDDVYDFDEYDPTPYGGGYDLVMTYGKPLPASDAICYPRSGNDSEVKTLSASDPVLAPLPRPVDEAIVRVAVDGVGDKNESDSSFGSEMSDIEDEEASDGDVNSLHLHDADDGDREHEKVAVSGYAPKGYEPPTSESPGFCDGIYGYLPCLNKKRNKTIMSADTSNSNVEMANEAPWRAAADFIFGSLNPYEGIPSNTNYS